MLLSSSVTSNSGTPRTVAHQASLSVELSRQEYWSGLSFPSPGDLPDPGIESKSLASPSLTGRWCSSKKKKKKKSTCQCRRCKKKQHHLSFLILLDLCMLFTLPWIPQHLHCLLIWKLFSDHFDLEFFASSSYGQATQDGYLDGRSQDGGGIGRGDHFLFYKFIERTTEQWTEFTKQLLIASSGHQAPRKAAHCLRREVGQKY